MVSGGLGTGRNGNFHSISIDFSYAGRMSSKELIYIMAVVNNTVLCTLRFVKRVYLMWSYHN